MDNNRFPKPKYMITKKLQKIVIEFFEYVCVAMMHVAYS